MKFIVFNIVVAAALIYLVANQGSGLDVSLPKLDGVTASAEKIFDSALPPAPPTPPARDRVDAPTIAAADLTTRLETRLEVPEPEPQEAAVAPPLPAAVPPLPTVPAIEIPVREAHVLRPPAPIKAPLDLTVAQRRAEVLDEAPEPAQATSDRRRQLLDLAEEMEFLAAEFTTQ